MKPLFLLLLIAMNLLWAGSYPIYKHLSLYLGSGSIATLRYALAAVGMLAIWQWLPGKMPKPRDLARVFMMGILVFCVAPRLQIEGVHRGQAGDTSLLLALDPLITALAAAIFLREQITAKRWVGCGLGILGVLLISRVWDPNIQRLEGLVANCIFISSFIAETAYSVMGKPLLERASPFKMLGLALVSGTLANLLLDFFGGAHTFAAVKSLPLSAWVMLLYMAVVATIIGYSLWYVVIRETDVNLTGLTVFVQPVAGLALSVIFLKEHLHWGQLWGSLVIVAGLMIGLRTPRQFASMARAIPRLSFEALIVKPSLRLFR